MMFADRVEAGRRLGAALSAYAGRDDVLVLGLARGGIPVAAEVAGALGAPHDVAIARKLGVPGIEEVALGAIAENDDRIVRDDVAWYIGVPDHVVDHIAARARVELAQRAERYRAGRPSPDVRGRCVLLIDDGLATGATMRAAARAIRRGRPRCIIAAVPVAAAAGAESLQDVDGVVAVHRAESFSTVSDWYDDFTSIDGDRPSDTSVVRIATDDGEIIADREGGGDGRTLVVFAHGGGSHRGSYRNRYLAGRLRLAGFATLRVDLLTPDEQRGDAESGCHRFDVARLTRRLVCAIDWSGADRIALVGASTGAAAALIAAGERPRQVRAVVSRGGRVDLAREHASRVRAPTLLVVGGADAPTLRGNRATLPMLPAGSRLATIEGAGHTFEECGALGAVGEHTAAWLTRHA